MNAPPKITIMSSRDFNQDTGRAKRAAQKGPVFITTRGEPTHVLMTKAEFDRVKTLQQQAEEKRPFVSLAEMLAHPESAHIDFDVPEFKGPSTLKIPDLSD